MNERDGLWRIHARLVNREYDSYVDWEEEFYECPCCGEPIYCCDWEEEDFVNFICPVCEEI